MPIPASVVAVGSPGTPQRPQVSRQATAPVLTLSSTAGTQALVGGNGNGFLLLWGMTGVGLAEPELAAVPVPDGDGSTLLGGIRYGERELFVPVYLGAGSFAGLRDMRRSLEAMVDPKLGPTTVSVRQPDTGEERSVDGFYVGGMEGSYTRADSGWNWQRFGLTFRCLDPFWYGTPVVDSWQLESGTKPFLSLSEPFFPVVLGSSTVAGRRTIVNPGDEDGWPVWLLTGPGDSAVMTNNTTGRVFELEAPVAAGKPVTVDTRRGVKDVFDVDGDRWADVTLTSDLWPLVPGPNVVTVTMVSATPDSSVGLSFDPPYRSGH